MAKSKKSKLRDWVAIKADYEVKGIGPRELERLYGVPNNTISARAKREGWVERKFEQQKSNVVNGINDLIEQTNEQERVRILPEIENAAAMMKKSIINIHKGALNVHNLIVKKTYDGLISGEISANEASKNMANSGLKIDQIDKANNNEPQSPQGQSSINGANLEAIVKKVLSADDDSIINNLEESC